MNDSGLWPTVGGVIELHYSHPLLGPVYPIRLAVTSFDAVPSGPYGDYLYNGAAGYTPSEAGIRDTFVAISRLWAQYYDAGWSCVLAAVYLNTAGAPEPNIPVPAAPTVAGTGSSPTPTGGTAKRTIALYSSASQRWRIWLRQLAVAGVGQTEPTTASVGGIDARDRAWYAYFAPRGSGVVGRNGLPIQGEGTVRGWWDTPPAPYVVSG